MKKIVGFTHMLDKEQFILQNPLFLIENKIHFPLENKFYILYAENIKNRKINIEGFQEYIDNYLCEYDAKIQFSEIEWEILNFLWNNETLNNDIYNIILNKIDKNMSEENKSKEIEKINILLGIFTILSPSTFSGLKEEMIKKLKKLFLLSLKLLQKYSLNNNDIKTLINIKKGFLKIQYETKSPKLKDRIIYQLLCIQEKLFLYDESDYISLLDLRKDFINFFIKKGILNKVSPLYFISTPLRMEIYYYVSLVLKISETVDYIFKKERKNFYKDFFGEEKNYDVMGAGFLNGYRKITLRNITKFIEKYKNRTLYADNLYDLYFNFFEHDKIFSLISINYEENKILDYEKDILYKNNTTGLKNLKFIAEKENNRIDYELPSFQDAFDSNTKIFLGTLYEKIELGKTYIVNINVSNLNKNLKEYERIFSKFSEAEKKFKQKASDIEKYITFTSLLLEKINSENLYPLIYIKFLEKKEEFYLCEFRIKLKTGKYHYIELFILENDIRLMGLVKETRTFFNV